MRTTKNPLEMELDIAPSAPEVERAIIGLMLILPRCVPEVLNALPNPAIFYNDKYATIFKAIQEIYQKGGAIDMLTVPDYMGKMGMLAAAGESSLSSPTVGDIMACTNAVTGDAHITDWLEILKEKFMQREARKIGAELFIEAYSTAPQELFSTAQERMKRLEDSLTCVDEYDLSGTIVEMIKERSEREPGKLRGLDGGLVALNRETSGLLQPDLIIIAARPGQGKTAVVVAMADSLTITQKVPTAIFSLEMSKQQLLTRIESKRAAINSERIQNNMLTEAERQRLYAVDGEIAAAPLYIDDTPGLSINQLENKVALLIRKYGIKAVFVDYLQLMRGSGRSGGGNREAEISEISRGLKLIAKKYKIPVIALSQLSREVEKRPDKKPQLSDLRESGAIEQDADIVIFLFRPAYYGFTDLVEVGGVEFHPSSLMIMIIAKNRHNQPKNIALYCDLSVMEIRDQVDQSTGELYA